MSITSVSTSNLPSGLLFSLRQGFVAHGLCFFILAIYLAILIVMRTTNPDHVAISTMSSGFTVVSGCLSMLVFLAILVALQATLINRSSKPLSDIWQRFKRNLGNRDGLARALPACLIISGFTVAFTEFKGNITSLVPFSWDQTFDQWDQQIHFGTRPWEWLQPLFGSLPATLALNVNYNAWFFFMMCSMAYFVFLAAPGYDRTRFFVAFMLTWSIGGSGLATYFASAGPCYFGQLVPGADPYAPLVQQLQLIHKTVPIWALDTQSVLMELREKGSVYGGVSAMPSMHNATTLLLVLAFWNMGKGLRWLFVGHAVLVFLGSIHLAWHYAVDSYLAWALVVVVWLIAGRLAAWWESKPHTMAFAAQYAKA
jgi:hypothetical protein